MTIKHVGLSLALATALFSSGNAFAGDGCCGEKAKDTAAKPEQCSLAKCDEKLAAADEAVLAKLAAPATKPSADDLKTVAEAQKTLVTTCPVGHALTSSLPTLLEAIEAVRALDTAMEQGGKALPADCQSKDGGCAFCAEAGAKCSAEAKAAMRVSTKAIARAEKIARALATIAATYPGTEVTTKPAGSPAQVPAKEAYAKLAERTEAAAKVIAAGFAKVKALPEAEQKKIHDAVATLDKLQPSVSPTNCAAGYMALFADLGLAKKAIGAFEAASPAKADPKFFDSLSPNAKNAFALFGARSAVVMALGGVADAACAGECGDKGGDCCKEKAAEKDCGKEKAEKAKAAQ